MISSYPALDCCMYCGCLKDLSREHIFPFGLGGLSVLPKSSCRKCAVETGRFERDVLRGPFWGLRAHLGIQSRRPQDRPKKLPLAIVQGGGERIVNLRLANHPLPLFFPQFAPPSKLTGNHVSGITVNGVFTYGFGRPLAEILKLLKADGVKMTQSIKPISFARMIAKIGWAMACAERRVESLDPDSCIGSVIVEKPDDIGQWVGTYTGRLEKVENTLHEIRLRENKKQGYLFADLKFFADSETPRYGVILGTLK